MKCGLLGQKLGHSYSPQIHSKLADYDYSLFEKEPDELAAFLQSGEFSGLNVTIPYKKMVIPYLSELSPIAAKLGAVNTIVRREDGNLIGHNTDYFGFRTMVESSGLKVNGKKVLVLGSGGASNTAAAVLEELGSQVIVISRNGENNYQNLQLHKDAAVIVNTTPVGMYPNNGETPIDLSLFPKLEGVLDVIFNPAHTRLLLDAQARGCVAVNGLLMLVAQAKESAEWFTGRSIENDCIQRIYKELSLQTQNIVLIGMPGCGKSTIGKALAQETGRCYVDADDEIDRYAGRSIPEIFASDGEEGFRKIETTVLEALGKRSGLILSTGGGCVTRLENYPLLHQNGKIIWITRNLDILPTDGRPLSQTQNLSHMYKIRRPLYERFADLTIPNETTVSETVRRIIEELEL